MLLSETPRHAKYLAIQHILHRFVVTWNLRISSPYILQMFDPRALTKTMRVNNHRPLTESFVCGRKWDDGIEGVLPFRERKVGCKWPLSGKEIHAYISSHYSQQTIQSAIWLCTGSLFLYFPTSLPLYCLTFPPHTVSHSFTRSLQHFISEWMNHTVSIRDSIDHLLLNCFSPRNNIR